MSKNTPGPWEIEIEHVPGRGGFNDHPPYDITRIVDKTLGNVLWERTIARLNKTEHAHLIAAAPELLEACHSALIMFDSFGGHESTGLVEILQSAINKAEGKS